MTPEGTMTTPSNACDLAAVIRRIDFADRAVTLIGYGAMGRHYLAAFRALGVGRGVTGPLSLSTGPCVVGLAVGVGLGGS